MSFDIPTLIDVGVGMPSITDDAGHWLDLASEARAIAATMTNPGPKLVMLDVAACYMRLAQFAEERSQGPDFSPRQS